MIRTRERIARLQTLKAGLANAIKSRRLELKITQQQTAAQFNVDRSELARIECGKLERFTVDRLCMILMALGGTPTLAFDR